MPIWPVQDAKARFSELLNACVSEGPQVVTRRGTETAVLVPIDEWRRLQAAARPSLKQWLLTDSARTDRLVPERGKARAAYRANVSQTEDCYLHTGLTLRRRWRRGFAPAFSGGRSFRPRASSVASA